MDPSKRKDFLGLFGFLVLCLLVSGIGGYVTASSVSTWYPTLVKPAFNPPDWVFAPVWTTLYILMAIAGWRIWRLPKGTETQSAIRLFAVQLALNLLWSFLFFGFQRADLAFVEIVIFLSTIVMTTNRFWKLDRMAGFLFFPYILWVSFATLLNGTIWYLNKI